MTDIDTVISKARSIVKNTDLTDDEIQTLETRIDLDARVLEIAHSIIEHETYLVKKLEKRITTLRTCIKELEDVVEDGHPLEQIISSGRVDGTYVHVPHKLLLEIKRANLPVHDTDASLEELSARYAHVLKTLDTAFPEIKDTKTRTLRGGAPPDPMQLEKKYIDAWKAKFFSKKTVYPSHITSAKNELLNLHQQGFISSTSKNELIRILNSYE